MRFQSKVIMLAAVVCMGSQVLSEPNDSQTGPPPIAVDAWVINDASSPLPVSGDVNASVSGEVRINSVPASLTEQLDVLIEKVEMLSDEVAAIDTRPRPANYARSFSKIVGEKWAVNLPKPVLVSLITVSTQDDEATLWFCDDASDVTDCADDIDDPPNIKLGERKQWPSILTLPFPQPVKIQSFQLLCGNIVENCEFTISIVGTEIDP